MKGGRRTHGFFTIHRHDVEARAVDAVVRRLRSLSDDAALVRDLAQSCAFEFAGYSADPRELHEIPEVRAFFGAVTTQWPYWAHFLVPEPSLVRVFVLMGADGSRYKEALGTVWVSADAESVNGVLRTWRSGLERLHQRHGIPPETTDALWHTVEACLPGEFRGLRSDR
ncbi:hypothetical protein [Luteimonas sp. MHLX1A]|uniref:hypothetical protein n=1 Tax=Alterluteimonas muca TaxID=2878684 RepID=UPI001E4B74D6|nr:hypothetical protein [Luteimonas sp. MHLX1A]MCD9046779.1 hypothetical protein [Luteimonas sp. MHLX1A]